MSFSGILYVQAHYGQHLNNGAFQVAYGTNEGMQIINHVQNATIGSSGQYNIPNSTAHINGPPGTKLNNITILESPN